MPRRDAKTQSKVRNWAALGTWKRRRQMNERIDEVRYWFLRCKECEHSGGIEATLRKLRSANLICSQCGVPMRRKSR